MTGNATPAKPGIIESVMSAFRTPAPASPAPNNQQQPNPNQAPVPPAPTTSQTSNPTVPSASTPRSDGSLKAIPAAGEGVQDPLAEFADLWQAPVVDPKAPPAPSLSPKFTVDPKKMMDAAQKIDFRKAISPELITKATSGDQAAMMDVINGAAQAAYAQAAIATTKIVENALERQQQGFEAVMPEILRRHNVSNAVREDNPLFDDPAMAPLLQTVEQQFATKFPDKSSDQISAAAKNYLNGFATKVLTNAGMTVTAPQPQRPGSKARKETDWENYFFQTPGQ